MGKKIIIQGANFSANGIVIPMTIKIKANQSITIEGTTYSGGENGAIFELDAIPTTLRAAASSTAIESVSINDSDFILSSAYFENNAGLTDVRFLMDSFSSATSLLNTFSQCKTLQSITGLGNINTKNVTNLGYLFRYCTQLTSIDVSSFDTAYVTNMMAMFSGCSNLTSLDLSSFKTSRTSDMSRMFAGCPNLQTLTLGENWDMITGNPSVEDTFYSCDKLASIIAPACVASQYATEGTQIKKLIDVISGSGFPSSSRQLTSLVITCANNETVIGTYDHDTGWSWSLS